jgi:hypothetical protein
MKYVPNPSIQKLTDFNLYEEMKRVKIMLI